MTCKKNIIQAIPRDNMNVSRLIVHDQQVEETRPKIKSIDSKSARSFDGCSSKGRLDIKDKPMFKKWYSNHVPKIFSKAWYDMVSNPKSQKGRGISSPNKKLTCGKCGKKHYGNCLVGKDNFFRCGKNYHKVRD